MKTINIKRASFLKFLKTMITENGRSVQISATQFGGEASVEIADEKETAQLRNNAHSGNYLAGASGMLNPGLFK
ncbi:MAG: hypothetical protein ABW174_06195 [Flavitalea sp.]